MCMNCCTYSEYIPTFTLGLKRIYLVGCLGYHTWRKMLHFLSRFLWKPCLFLSFSIENWRQEGAKWHKLWEKFYFYAEKQFYLRFQKTNGTAHLEKSMQSWLSPIKFITNDVIMTLFRYGRLLNLAKKSEIIQSWHGTWFYYKFCLLKRSRDKNPGSGMSAWKELREVTFIF